MKTTQIRAVLGLTLIIVVALALGSNKEGFITLPDNSTIQQWDLTAINSALKANGFMDELDAKDTNGMTSKSIDYFANGPYTVPYTVNPEVTKLGEWTDANSGVCVSDDGNRSIQFNDGHTDMFPGLPTLNNANLSEDERTKILKNVNLTGLDDHKKKYEVCKAYANYRDATVFGLQYSEWCLVGTTNEAALGKKILNGRTYTNYGICGHQNGAGWLNSVYTRPSAKSPTQYTFDSSKLTQALQTLKSQNYYDMNTVITNYNSSKSTV